MENKHNTHNKNSQSRIAFIGAAITLLGGFFLSYNYIEAKRIYAEDYMASNFFQEEKPQQEIEITELEGINEPVEDQNIPDVVTNDYIGYLIIPKINLTKGFLDKRAPDNDVEKNIMVVEESNYPDTDKGNLIIAGHSGTGWKAFFNDLYKLEIGDLATVTYNNKKYNYKITNIYKQEKTGKIAIYRDYKKTTLTLITCTNFESTTQTVYIAELINIEE